MTDQELEDARKTWIRDQPRFKQLGIELVEALKNEIRREGIWAEVESRPKEIDSLIRKLIRKPEHTYDSLGDKVGVRVIVRYKDEVGLVLRTAGRLFELSNVENTADRLKPDAVGYLSVHAAVRFWARDAKASEYPPDRFSAELQVRTLAQHLWAEMAYDSVYKNDETLRPLSDQLKRRIYILAGAIELADEEFNRIEREMPSVPELSVLKALERHHYKLTTRRGDPELSLDVIRLLTPLYSAEIGQIVARLDEFYSSHEDILREVYGRAEDMPDRSAFLFQPEALMIYDLLESDQLELRKAWNERYPDRELERVANAFGISFD
jgi:ppGpp synthetase/RelA/SpoT-type nucleotidyltranferase